MAQEPRRVKPLKIAFPAKGVRQLVEFAWTNLERQYGLPRRELQVWPELVFNADFKSGVFLFPLVESEAIGELPRVFALGGQAGCDTEWREMVVEVEKAEWTMFGIHMECLESVLETGGNTIVVLSGEEIEIVESQSITEI